MKEKWEEQYEYLINVVFNSNIPEPHQRAIWDIAIELCKTEKEHKWLSEKFEEVAKENYRLRQEIAGVGVKLIDLMRAAQ